MLNAGLTVLGLSRFQFAMTTVFHFFFVPFSIGLAVIVAVMETMYVIKKRGNLQKKWRNSGVRFSYTVSRWVL